MSYKDFVPTTDAGLLAFALQFSTKITADPVVLGLTAANATALSTAVSDYQAKYTAATDPATRGKSTCFAKDTSRANLRFLIRQYARAIQGTLTVTNQQREELGLTVRDVEPTPWPTPGKAGVEVISVSGQTVLIRIYDPLNPTRRGKPLGVAGTTIVSYIGEEPSLNPAEWTFQGNTTRTKIQVAFPSTLAAGTKVWISAFFFNPRGASGQAADPTGTNLQGGALMAA